MKVVLTGSRVTNLSRFDLFCQKGHPVSGMRDDRFCDAIRESCRQPIGYRVDGPRPNRRQLTKGLTPD
jgi:hypothetical protein